MNHFRKSFAVLITSLLLVAIVAFTAQPAEAQHVTTWTKRQVKGAGRHVALRHHKPARHHRTAKHKKTTHHTKHHG